MNYLLALLIATGCTYDAQLQTRDEVRAQYPCWATYEDFESFLDARLPVRRQMIDDQLQDERWRHVRRAALRTGFL